MQEFLSIESEHLQKARKFITQEISKRIHGLKANTGNSDADISHLSDNEYIEVMNKHRDNMNKQLKLQLVQQLGQFPDPGAARKAHGRLKLELLFHAHDHTNVLLQVAKAADAVTRHRRTASGVQAGSDHKNLQHMTRICTLWSRASQWFDTASMLYAGACTASVGSLSVAGRASSNPGMVTPLPTGNSVSVPRTPHGSRVSCQLL